MYFEGSSESMYMTYIVPCHYNTQYYMFYSSQIYT